MGSNFIRLHRNYHPAGLPPEGKVPEFGCLSSPLRPAECQQTKKKRKKKNIIEHRAKKSYRLERDLCCCESLLEHRRIMENSRSHSKPHCTLVNSTANVKVFLWAQLRTLYYLCQDLKRLKSPKNVDYEKTRDHWWRCELKRTLSGFNDYSFWDHSEKPSWIYQLTALCQCCSQSTPIWAQKPKEHEWSWPRHCVIHCHCTQSVYKHQKICLHYPVHIYIYVYIIWSGWRDYWMKNCRAAGARGLCGHLRCASLRLCAHAVALRALCTLCARLGGRFKTKCWAAWMNQHLSAWRCESLAKDTGLQTPDECKLLLRASRVKCFIFLTWMGEIRAERKRSCNT